MIKESSSFPRRPYPTHVEPKERVEDRMVTGAITEPCLAGKHDECRLAPTDFFTRCGCQAIGCHVERDCEFDKFESVPDCDGIAQIELIQAKLEANEKPLLMWICQWCFDHYCTKLDDGTIVIDHTLDKGRYTDHKYVISARAN